MILLAVNMSAPNTPVQVPGVVPVNPLSAALAAAKQARAAAVAQQVLGHDSGGAVAAKPGPLPVSPVGPEPQPPKPPQSSQPQAATLPTSAGSNLLVNPPIGEQQKPSQTIVTIHLDVGESRIINIEGNQFFIIASTTGIPIKTKGSIYNTYPTRTGRKLATGFFAAIEMQNPPGAVAQDITIAIGNDQFIDCRII